MPLYRYIGGVDARTLPVPMMNILNGGKHAEDSTDIQEFMVLPVGAPTFPEAVRWGAEVYHALKKVLHERKLNTNVGDEGGFAPSLGSNREALDLLVRPSRPRATRRARTSSSASTPPPREFYEDGKYPRARGAHPDLREMVDLYDMGPQLPDHLHRRRPGGGRLAGLGRTDGAAGRRSPARRRRIFVTNTERLRAASARTSPTRSSSS